MRRAVTAFLLTGAVIYLLASFKVRAPALHAGSATPTPAPARTATRTPAPAPAHTRRHRHTAPATRTATGDAIQYPYGVLQVKATLTQGRLTGVQMALLQPQPGRSEFIDAQAIPMLRSEALQAQSAQVDVISGATYTSEAYARSLQSAIDRAHAA